MNNDGQFKAIVFTTFKSQSGFIVHATQRGDDLTEAYTELGKFIKAQGGVAYEKPSGFQKKPVEYTGEMCPLCKKGRLVKPTAPNRPIKCEFGKYNYQTKQTDGCQYVKWDNVKSGFEQDMSV